MRLYHSIISDHIVFSLNHCIMSEWLVRPVTCMLAFLCLARMQTQRTPLHEAATSGNTSMVEFLMANFNTNLDAKDLVSWASIRSSSSRTTCRAHSWYAPLLQLLKAHTVRTSSPHLSTSIFFIHNSCCLSLLPSVAGQDTNAQCD